MIKISKLNLLSKVPISKIPRGFTSAKVAISFFLILLNREYWESIHSGISLRFLSDAAAKDNFFAALNGSNILGNNKQK